MTYMTTPYTNNPNIGGHEIYFKIEINFSRPFLLHHYYILSLSDLSPRVEKKILLLLPYNYLPLDGIMKFTISYFLSLHTKFGKDWPSSTWEEDINP